MLVCLVLHTPDTHTRIQKTMMDATDGEQCTMRVRGHCLFNQACLYYIRNWAYALAS